MGCLKITYRQEPDFRVIYSKKELTLKNSSQKVYRSYLYGFNGQERVNELKSLPYDFGNRLYDPRRGQFPTPDRLAGKFPNLSPYVYAANTPIQAIDKDGDAAWVVIKDYYYNNNGKSIKTVQNWIFDEKLLNANGVYEVHRHHPNGYTPSSTKGYSSGSWSVVPYSSYPNQFPNEGKIDMEFSFDAFIKGIYGEVALNVNKLFGFEFGANGKIGMFGYSNKKGFYIEGPDDNNFELGGGIKIATLNVGHRVQFESNTATFGKQTFSTGLITKKGAGVSYDTDGNIRAGIPSYKVAAGAGFEVGARFSINKQPKLSDFEKRLKLNLNKKNSVAKTKPSGI